MKIPDRMVSRIQLGPVSMADILIFVASIPVNLFFGLLSVIWLVVSWVVGGIWSIISWFILLALIIVGTIVTASLVFPRTRKFWT